MYARQMIGDSSAMNCSRKSLSYTSNPRVAVVWYALLKITQNLSFMLTCIFRETEGAVLASRDRHSNHKSPGSNWLTAGLLSTPGSIASTR